MGDMVDLIRENLKTGYPEGVNYSFFFKSFSPAIFLSLDPTLELGTWRKIEKRQLRLGLTAAALARRSLLSALCPINQVGAYRVQRVFCGSGWVRVGEERIF